MKIIPTRKKVKISDIASPKPSRAATRVVNIALKRAYKDQKTIFAKAYSK